LNTLDPTTTAEEKLAKFNSSLRDVLKVSKAEMAQKVADAEEIRRRKKRKPGPTPRRSSASGRASDNAV
jgi:hypothetical protein